MGQFFKGIWLKAKTLKLLKEEYLYDPAVPGFQNGVFSGCIKHALRVGGDEHDAAALFMISQIGMMPDPQSLDDKDKEFVRRIRDQVWVEWDRLVIRDELRETMEYLDRV